MSGWIGVDFDGTLAFAEDGNKRHGIGYCGAPIPAMLERVKGWLAEGREVRILTARVASSNPADMVLEARFAIETWCAEHLGRLLPVTAEKDYLMVELWDDRAVQVIANTGEPMEDFAARIGAKGERDRLDAEASKHTHLNCATCGVGTRYLVARLAAEKERADELEARIANALA